MGSFFRHDTAPIIVFITYGFLDFFPQTMAGGSFLHLINPAKLRGDLMRRPVVITRSSVLVIKLDSGSKNTLHAHDECACSHRSSTLWTTRRVDHKVLARRLALAQRGPLQNSRHTVLPAPPPDLPSDLRLRLREPGGGASRNT